MPKVLDVEGAVEDEGPLDSRKDGLEERWLQEPGLLPFLDKELAEAEGGAELARHSDDDEVAPLCVVDHGADHDR